MINLNTKHNNNRNGVARAARLAFVIVLVLNLAGAIAPSARADDSKDEAIDGRLEGYPQRVALAEPSGPVLIWLLFGVLATVAIGVTFTSSKRSHLD